LAQLFFFWLFVRWVFSRKSTFFRFVVSGFVAVASAVLWVSLYRDVSTAHVQVANYKAVVPVGQLPLPETAKRIDSY